MRLLEAELARALEAAEAAERAADAEAEALLAMFEPDEDPPELRGAITITQGEPVRASSSKTAAELLALPPGAGT